MAFSITFNNLSGVNWSLSNNGLNFLGADSGSIHFSQSPGQTMGPAASQTSSLNDDFILGNQRFDQWCCWLDEAAGVRFGIRIHNPGQFNIGLIDESIGTPPYWYWENDTGLTGPATQYMNDSPNWQLATPVASPWTITLSNNVTVTATPTIGDSSLSISVLIETA